MINWKRFDIPYKKHNEGVVLNPNEFPPDCKWSLFIDKKGRVFTARFVDMDICLPHFYPPIKDYYDIDINEEDIVWWAEVNWPDEKINS